MKFTKIKHQLWLLVTEDGKEFYGTSKTDCLNQLEENTRQKATLSRYNPRFFKKRSNYSGVKKAF